jgi:hypothetical protein
VNGYTIIIITLGGYFGREETSVGYGAALGVLHHQHTEKNVWGQWTPFRVLYWNLDRAVTTSAI